MRPLNITFDDFISLVNCEDIPSRYSSDICVGDKLFNKKDLIRIIDRNKINATVDSTLYGRQILKLDTIRNNYTLVEPAGTYKIILVKYTSEFTKLCEIPTRYDLIATFSPNTNALLYDYCLGTMDEGIVSITRLSELYRFYSRDYNIKMINRNIKALSTDEVMGYFLNEASCIDYAEFSSLYPGDGAFWNLESEDTTRMKLLGNINIHIYLDDTPDSICNLLHTYSKQINPILKVLNDDVCKKFGFKDIYFGDIDHLFKYVGPFDIMDSLFDVYESSFECVEAPNEKDKSKLNGVFYIKGNDLLEILYNSTVHQVHDVMIVKYWYDIDFESINTSYQVVRNLSDFSVYVITYIEDTSSINSYYTTTAMQMGSAIGNTIQPL